jgi:hypothetical protein
LIHLFKSPLLLKKIYFRFLPESGASFDRVPLKEWQSNKNLMSEEAKAYSGLS